MAHYDMITELPNRQTIIEKIHELIELSKDKKIIFYTVF
jgi:GGDEF domain-containing protein